MSWRGQVLLTHLREANDAVDDVELALMRYAHVDARPGSVAAERRRLLCHMRAFLRARLSHIRGRYHEHVCRTARSCGVPIK